MYQRDPAAGLDCSWGNFQIIEIFLCLVIGINETVVPVFNCTTPPLALSGVSSGIHKK
jgi:hypothetical protein